HRFEAAYHHQQGALAAARRPENRDELPSRHAEADRTDRLDRFGRTVAVDLSDLRNLDVALLFTDRHALLPRPPSTRKRRAMSCGQLSMTSTARSRYGPTMRSNPRARSTPPVPPVLSGRDQAPPTPTMTNRQ